MKTSALLPAIIGTLMVLAPSVRAAEAPTPAGLAFYEQKVRPLLSAQCYSCHSAQSAKIKGGLRLDTPDGWEKGGASGEAVVLPGQPEKSALIRAVQFHDAALTMPPGRKLPDADIETLVTWVKMGAPAPRNADTKPRADAAWWSVQPVKATPLPSPPKLPTAWAKNPIDRFIFARLAQNNLQPASRADRRTLIRRLSFDLLGLPPTPERMEQFVRDTAPDAYEKLVDEFLVSPHYGERWARHWLDIAHYADTHGFERDQLRPNAWRYRDYVIKSLNDDKPYDRFVREQIAGDVIAPNDREAVIATGFLAAGPWDFVGQVETQSPTLKRAARAGDLDDMVTQVMTSTVGMTVNCARCHDHKLDPISQREYYSLWSVFAGLKRADRDISPVEVARLAATRQELETSLQTTRTTIARLRGDGYDLADIVGGGDGRGSGKIGAGVDQSSGKAQSDKRGYLEGAKTNQFARATQRFVDGVVIPDGGEDGKTPVPISSTGITVTGVPKTSGQAWDAVRNGAVNDQFSTKLGETDFATGHTLLGLHANAAITFDLAELRKAGVPPELKFVAGAGYFGQTPKNGADFRVFVDGELKTSRDKIGRDDGLFPFEIALPAASRFLTLMATDGGNGIGMDQICFTDAKILLAQPTLADADKAELARLETLRDKLENDLKNLSAPEKVYAVASETAPAVKILKRGDPETPGDDVTPGTLSWVAALPADFGTNELAEGARRIALANWICDSHNPLTPRVLVNRLWHHHFGQGLVTTPSDFGRGGDKPSHPELLDYLAGEFLARDWSQKALHRLICSSETYKQSSAVQNEKATQIDAGNRLLWRQNSRRLDAESLRDAVLQTSGKLNLAMGGPGYRDFDYKEEYAPVYSYITPDAPALWRRSIYRFVVRTTPHQFMSTLDSPNPANFTPVRSNTTTSLQALTLSNNEFMLKQARYLAARIAADVGTDETAQVNRAFALTLQRAPGAVERGAASKLVRAQSLFALCRMLLNANEFVYVD